MSLAERLTLAMRIKGITEATLGKSVGVSQTTIWKLKNGKTSSNRKIYEIANYLNVNLNWLVNGKGGMDNNSKENKIDYIGKVKEESIIIKGEALMKTDGAFQINEDFNGRLKLHSDDPNAFVLKIKGDSMFPRLNSGEFVVIEPNIEPCSGDEVLVRTKDGCNMIKKLECHRNCTYRFTCVNQEHPPITLDENQVDKIMFIAAIVKSTKYLDIQEI